MHPRYRTTDGQVDLVIENEDGDVDEAKTGGTYRSEDVDGLAHLPDGQPLNETKRLVSATLAAC